MKNIFISFLLCIAFATTTLAQTPSYCSTIVVREPRSGGAPPLYDDRTLTLTSVGAPTVGCPNGYPVWQFVSVFVGTYKVSRDPADCNKWLAQVCNPGCTTYNSITTASPTDNPPASGWPTFSLQVVACNTPMPVRLVSFVAEAKDNRVLLKWATAEEANNKGFEVERSVDALTFKSVGGLDGRGTSQTRQSYEFVDSAAQPGVNYYRLKQIDFDGRFQYSAVVSVINDFGVGVFPNPAQVAITLTLPQDLKTNVKIINAQGTTVKELPMAEMSKTLNIGSYAAGEYWVLFSDEAGRWLKSVKILKQ